MLLLCSVVNRGKCEIKLTTQNLSNLVLHLIPPTRLLRLFFLPLPPKTHTKSDTKWRNSQFYVLAFFLLYFRHCCARSAFVLLRSSHPSHTYSSRPWEENSAISHLYFRTKTIDSNISSSFLFIFFPYFCCHSLSVLSQQQKKKIVCLKKKDDCETLRERVTWEWNLSRN